MSIIPLSSQTVQPILVPSSLAPSSGNVVENSVASTSNRTSSKDAQNQQPSEPPSQKTANGINLNDPEVKKVIAQLQARDQEVRIHEQTHVAVGGQYVTSGPSYSYQTGPDGRRYAVGGNVGIDVSPIANNPEATLMKARQVMQAALAPAEPSSQDYAVAQSAQSMMLQAQQEISAQKTEQANGDDDSRLNNVSLDERDRSDDDNKKSLQNNLTLEQRAGRLYEQTDIATNALAGSVGGYQDKALRLGVSFQA